MNRVSIVLTALLLAVAGCGGVGQGRSDKLRDTITKLNEGVRWGRLQDVLAHVDPESQEHFLEMHEGFHDTIRLSGYEIVNTTVDMDAGKATVGIKLSWYRVDQMEEHTTVLLQHWEEKEREWWLVSEEFVSGQPF